MGLDPFLLGALHLQSFNGHGQADGEIAVSGSLQHPESLVVGAKFSRLFFTYANVQLENVGAVHFGSSKDSFQIGPVELREPSTSIRLTGSVSVSERGNESCDLKGRP